ncbi:hypothetical protein CONLIGDRAFT_707263 [Coniochaeta ligniaria NRRL 30616]|uniref:PH domain-containing protein n=1 Tax=Coniochaeta ligniaria NRRL 30616 TaxID=1408157 RepID=A0A1J7JC34_9PEZI|nr:hypothetical protein CONLIGDRAFT_707263 [Coniochaeta ligniaria NRRL 30616]
MANLSSPSYQSTAPSHNPNNLSSPAPEPAPVSRSASHAGSYFPQSSPQQHPHLSQTQPESSHLASAVAADDVTRTNTIANTNPHASPLAASLAQRPAKFTEEWDASQRGSSVIDGPTSSTSNAMHRTSSYAGSIGPSEGSHAVSLSRGNTLKKKASIRRSGSLKRSGSRRSMKAGSVKSLALQSSNDPDEMHSAFYCPVPTTGNPTEALANRFQAWRKILKDLITYFREIQTHYEHRSKSLAKLANVLNSTATPQGFLQSGGLDDALQILRNYNKLAFQESNKAREIEEDVILALTGLRSDLQQKIKEIKNLSGDFKNAVDREMAATRKAVDNLQEVLGQTEVDPSLTTGKQDPYLLRLTVDRQLERQIDEENYLHQAYLNLETSGRELESIVVGEIQKSYNAYAGILKREADAAYSAVEDLRVGPIAMPKDHEWADFIQRDDQFVDPELPIRSAQFIHYPGRDHYACQEIRAGLLERKSKYLKSYTAGCDLRYVLSPTHLHEFKSADKTQAPVMSLYLPEQKLGSHSSGSGSSNKFILKGRQTGGMHRGHTWVFRAESHDTMMAWYEDIKALTEKSPEERSEYVRGHSRSFSRSSQRSFSSDGVVDEDDDEPFAASASVSQQTTRQETEMPRRPEPGGRFPSDLQVNAQRGLQVPVSPSSVSTASYERADPNAADTIKEAVALPGSAITDPSAAASRPGPDPGWGSTERTPMDEAPSHAAVLAYRAREDGVNPYTNEPFYDRSPATDNHRGDAAVGDGVGGKQRLDSTSEGRGLMVVGEEELTNTQSNSAAKTPETYGAESPQHDAYSIAGARGPTMADSTNAPSFVAYSSTPGHKAEENLAGAPSNGTMALPSRPTAGTTRNDTTISNLHVPGEYPKPTPNI